MILLKIKCSINLREFSGPTVLTVSIEQIFSRLNWHWFPYKIFSSNSISRLKIYLRSWTAALKKTTWSKSSETFGPIMVIWSVSITQVPDPHTQSKFYLIWSITRDGKRGITGEFKHKYKSITRFYNQNFWDFHKMNLVDILLEQKISDFENNRLPQMIKKR